MRKHIAKKTSRNSLFFISDLGYWDYLQVFWNATSSGRSNLFRPEVPEVQPMGLFADQKALLYRSTMELFNVAASDRHRAMATKGSVTTILESSFKSRCSRG